MRTKIVDLVRRNARQHAMKRRGVVEVSVVKLQPLARQMTAQVQWLDTPRRELAGTADDAMHLVTLGQQQLGEV